MSERELQSLELNSDTVKNILNEQRPPIPIQTVIKLLYESKRTCCVCRDNSRGIIIHHLVEWSKSKDHSESNLIVLCMEHHDLAHTHKDLSLNLTRKQLIGIKAKWIKEVELLDARTILGLSIKDYSRWDYFNHNRIFEMFLDKNISNKNFKATNTVFALGLINKLGTFGIANDKMKCQFYAFKDGYMLYYYMKEVFNEVLRTISLIDITDKFTKQDILSLVKPGTYIAIQAGFYFKTNKNESYGKKQMRQCYYQKNHIRMEFEFDAYETTCTSAWGSHLRGHRTVTPIGFVKSILEEEDYLIIRISCLAIGSYFENSNYQSKKYYG